MLTMLNTWQTGDVDKIHGDPDLQTALGRIKAKGLIMPSKTDLYFPVRFTRYVALRQTRLTGFLQPEDNEIEVKYLGDKAKLVVIDSIWGHVGKCSRASIDIMIQ